LVRFSRQQFAGATALYQGFPAFNGGVLVSQPLLQDITGPVGFLKHIEEGAPDGRNPYATTTVLFRVRVVVLAGMFLYGFRLNLPAGFMVLAWNIR
jgi:hypothetical protein